MYKITKSKSNPSKFNILTPSYNGSKLAPQSSRDFLNRSSSGPKKFGIRQMPLSPSSRLKQSKEKRQSKIQISNLNFNLLICQNKQSSFHSPFNLKNVTGKVSQGILKKNNFFKSKNMLKVTQKISELQEIKKRNEIANRFCFNPIKVIAKGQYGNLYLAYSKQLNFVAVLKSFNKQKVQTSFMIDQFKIQLYCKHPNILPAYGYFFGKSQAYLIMEAGSHNLYRIIKQHGYLSQRRAATYIHQILKGLAYLHLNGIIHRDIKPQNIIVCGNVLKISDFGWSIITQSDRKTFCGTLDYVSPEVSNGKSYDNKIDCWSVGVLAYELMTGFPPFEQIKGRKQKKQRPMLNYTNGIKFSCTTSKLGRQFVNKMLSHDPQIRLSAVQALRDPWIQSFSEQINKSNNQNF